MTDHNRFMRRAIALGAESALVDGAGGAFGSVIVMNGQVIGEGRNRVVSESDPTWHGEMEAIRAASRALGRFHLDGATLYTSAEPCPMCLGAAYWAHIDRIYFAARCSDAAQYGDFDDATFYDELRKPPEARRVPATELLRAEAIEVWKKYAAKADRTHY